MFITQLSQLTALQRIERAHIELMANKATMEYAGVIMVGKYVVDPNVRTACTDGVNCKYGKDFIESLSESDLRGLILHENLHKAFQHTFLWKHLYEQDARTANMACDYVINLIIKDISRDSRGFVTLPEKGLIDERFRGMDSQQVFDTLLQEGQGQGQGGEDGDEGAGLDDHDWSSGEQLPPEAQDQIRKEIDQALRQGQILAGKMGGRMSRELLGMLEPKVKWQDQLREFMSSLVDGKDISTWQRVNRRWLQHDMYMPSTLSESMGRVVIGIDTSGSIGGAVLSEFLSEVKAICENVKPELIDLLYWDTEVAAHEVYSRDELDKLTAKTKPAGGGGTNASCVPEYIKARGIKPECVIMLTDGYVGDWGKWQQPVLWCINTHLNSPVGQSIHI
jgi:predicted metal-dependent peptidase